MSAEWIDELERRLERERALGERGLGVSQAELRWLLAAARLADAVKADDDYSSPDCRRCDAELIGWCDDHRPEGKRLERNVATALVAYREAAP